MKHKKYFLIFIALVIFGCSEREEHRCYNDEFDFSIKLPTDWEIKNNFQGLNIIALEKQKDENDNYRENINVYVREIEKGLSLEEYYQQTLDEIKGMSDSLSVIEIKTQSINGEQSKSVLYKYNLQELKLTVMIYLFTKDEFGYNVTCVCESDSFDEYKNIFKQSVESFRLE